MNNDISNTLSFYQRLGSVNPVAKFILIKDYKEKSSIKEFVDWNNPKEPDYILKNFWTYNKIDIFKNLDDVLTKFCFAVGNIKNEQKENVEVNCYRNFGKNKNKDMSCTIAIQVKCFGAGPEIEVELLQRIITEKDIMANGVNLEQYIYTNYENRLLALISPIKKLCEDTRVKNNLRLISKCPACLKYTFIGESKDVCEFCDPEAYRAKKDEEEKIAKTHGYIYFCTDDQYIKIGSSNKYPDKRILSLSTRYHKKFTLLGYIYTDDFVKKEHSIHRILSSQRIQGEWFDISIDRLKQVLSEHSFCAKFLDQESELLTIAID